MPHSPFPRSAGFYTALPVEADDETIAGFGRTPAIALDELRDYLEWLYRNNPDRAAPGLCDAKLTAVKVVVRPMGSVWLTTRPWPS